MKRFVPVFVILSFVSILFLSIGYAKVSYDIKVSGTISLNSQKGIIINKVEKVSSIGAVQSKVLRYVGTFLTNSVHLDEDGRSSVIYRVVVENVGNDNYSFQKLLYDEKNDFHLYTNYHIIPSVLSKDELQEYNISLDDVIEYGDVLLKDEIKSFYLKYSYDESVIDDYGNVLQEYQELSEGMVYFQFVQVHSIEINNELYSVLDGESISIPLNVQPNQLHVYDSNHQLFENYQYVNSSLAFFEVHDSYYISVSND